MTQEALLAALRHWPVRGIPDQPSAWLLQVARRKALDALRRERTLREREGAVAREFDALLAARDAGARDPFADDQLRLVFLCCHPALPVESQIALTLKTAGGFGVGEIARALLAEEATIAQRLVRAKRLLRDTEAPLAFPDAAALPERLEGVLAALYLLFNEGYAASAGDTLLRADLCREALRLAELLLADPRTARPEVHALIALFAFQAARFPARVGDDGAAVRLADQDRGRWDPALTARGLRALDASASGPERTPYHLEAEIAGRHTMAPSWDATDWPGILAAYDALLARTGSPVVALNRVVALRETAGAEAALAELERVATHPRLRDYPHLHGVRGELLAALGRPDEAAEALRRGEAALRSTPLRAALEARRQELAG